jgi:F-type H+-transporting ATPase subunit b
MLKFLAIATQAAESAHAAAGDQHVENSAFGISLLTPGFFVALAMIVVILIMLRAGVPRIVAGMLDARIAEIRKQLDEAAKLRAEAEELRKSYEKKTREADKEIAELKANADKQAKAIVAKAKDDAKALVGRHQAMAEDKIAAAERAATDEIRAKAASAAAAAASTLIAEKHDASADAKLVDEVISGI